METASNEAKRMNCIGFEVKHTRAMDPSDGICAASLAAQLNWRKTHATIHRRWSRLAPKLVGGRIGLRRVDQPSGPGPVDSASAESNPGDRIGWTRAPANPVKPVLQWTADRAEGVGARVRPTWMDAQSSAGQSDALNPMRSRRRAVHPIANGWPSRPVPLPIQSTGHHRPSRANRIPNPMPSARPRLTQESDPVDQIQCNPEFC